MSLAFISLQTKKRKREYNPEKIITITKGDDGTFIDMERGVAGQGDYSYGETTKQYIVSSASQKSFAPSTHTAMTNLTWREEIIIFYCAGNVPQIRFEERTSVSLSSFNKKITKQFIAHEHDKKNLPMTHFFKDDKRKKVVATNCENGLPCLYATGATYSTRVNDWFKKSSKAVLAYFIITFDSFILSFPDPNLHTCNYSHKYHNPSKNNPVE